ncbi:MAG: phosphopantetheine-binding protein, partial [Acidimicrobiales bacterium]
RLGLTSMGTVELMVELEAKFGVEFPDALLQKSTFSTVGHIASALESAGASALGDGNGDG